MSEFIFPVSLSGFFFLAGVTLMFLGLRHSEPIERPIGLVDKKKPAEAGLINAEHLRESERAFMSVTLQ